MALAGAALAQPELVLEIGLELGRDEAHLREEMARRLRRKAKSVGQLVSKNTTASARERAVLGGAERQDVDPGAPGDLGRADDSEVPAHWRSGRRPCAASGRAPADLGDRGDLVRAIDGRRVGRLGEADRRRLDVMHPPLCGRGRAASISAGADLAAAHQIHQLGAAGEELRRAAFVDADMRVLWQ